MNEKEALKILEDNLELMREQSKVHKEAEESLDKNIPNKSSILGPKTDEAYQEMLNDIKESGEDE